METSSLSTSTPEPEPVSGPALEPSGKRPGLLRRIVNLEFLRLRVEITPAGALVCAGLCIACVLGLWWLVTAGEPEERIVSPALLSSPGETFGQLRSLWFDRALTRNTIASLGRVAIGFLLACIVGIPIGVACGCFTRVNAFFAPLNIFGRNIPIAALIPLTFTFFGIGEWQKRMFIFIATVAFIISDTAQAVRDVGRQYIDTAYTLGAKTRHIVLKVLVPLALPDVFNSLRILFGLAFGYIMLAELVKFGDEAGGLGEIILTSQRRGYKEHVLLVLILIPILAFAIDRLFFWCQRELFPHRYGGTGWLNQGVRSLIHLWEDVKGATFGATDLPEMRSGAHQGADAGAPPEKEQP